MEPRIQYAKTEDGVSIAFWTLGEGGTPLVLQPPRGISHIGLEWEDVELQGWYQHLAEQRMIVRYDSRGFGLSDRNIASFALETFVSDIQAVAGRLALQRFTLAGFGAWAVGAMAYTAQYPRRVSRLVLHNASARPNDAWERPELRHVTPLLEKDWRLFTETIAHVAMGWERGRVAHEWARFIRRGVTQDDFRRMMAEDVDASRLLSRIEAPTLVMQERRYPVEIAQQLASGIPNARLSQPADAPYRGDISAIQAIDEFLAEGEEPEAKAKPNTLGGLVTILFTDLASSTALTQRLGDAQAQKFVRAHNAIVREALATNGGSEIKHTGDGIMASFPTASGALECAIAIQRAVALRQAQGESESEHLAVHIGLNAGEPVAEESDLFGTAVQLARRICDEARAGQIFVSNVVRELAAGKGFLFSDSGEVALRGFEDPVRLYEVPWREDEP